MNNHINSIKLPNHIQYVLSTLFKTIDVYDYLKEDAWIAGGFPRIISKELNSNTSQTLEKVYRYFYSMGDIDIFSSDMGKVNEITNTISNRVKKIREEIMFDGFCVGRFRETIDDINSFELPFTFNYEKNLSCLSEICKKNKVSYVERFSKENSDLSVIQTQFVNKFIFKDIKECFDNFDFSNSKIAISFKDGEYYLHYTDLAEFYNARNLLNIEKVESPYLSSRITKYTKKYMFEIDDNIHFRNQIKDYLYKILHGKWPDVYHGSFNISSAVKNLHTSIDLDSNDLCLFLGMFTHMNRIRSNNGYGFMRNKIIEVDWATHEMRKKNG
jgi:hypothetical protein